MKIKLFGTDGVRGRVGEFPITPEFARRLGWVVGRVLAQDGQGKVLIGKDTRISGYLFESALEAGLSAAGLDVILLGITPTPAVAYLTRKLGAVAGIMISASHNGYQDNGFKFFSSNGTKLSDEVELAIEMMLEYPVETVVSPLPGRSQRVNNATERYIEFCKQVFPAHLDIKELNLVVDCANGANYQVTPKVLTELGAQIEVCSAQPNGRNINADCGSTQPEHLQHKVLEMGADAGIAVDGDGDRLIMVDACGELVDGDELLYVIASHQCKFDPVSIPGVVGTVMSNLGMELALKQMGICFSRAGVGDRHVLAQMQQLGWPLGGESSGHIIPLQHTTTGDSMIAALLVLEAMVRSGCSLHELKGGMQKFPQIITSVRTVDGLRLCMVPAVRAAVAEAEAALDECGRILLRPSGTEPVVRIMVEGADLAGVESIANQLTAVVAQHAGDTFLFNNK